MRKTVFLLAVVTLVSGCGSANSREQLAANKALVLRAHKEVWSGGDMEAAKEIYDGKFVGHWTGRPDTHGRKEFISFVTDARTRFPNWNETVEQVVAEGDLVVTRFTSRGTFKGQPSDGRKVIMREIAIHRIVDGKIAEQWTVADILAMKEQLGTLNTPEPGQE